MVLLVAVDVLHRQLHSLGLHLPWGFSWSKEAAMVLLVWNGFLGASLCARETRHVELDFGPKALPARLRTPFQDAGSLLLAAFLFGMTFVSGVYVFAPETGLLAREGNFELTGIPDWIVGAAIPTGFAILCLRAAATAAARLRTGRATAARAISVTLAVALVFATAVALAHALALGPTAGAWGVLPLLLLLAVLLAVGAPLYMIVGAATLLCFFLWEGGWGTLSDFTVLPERIRGLADTQALLAIPFFMLSGGIMSAGQISRRLVDFARALLGFLPGGLAIAGVFACVIFAAVSGSSPATLAAIGPFVAPALVRQGHREDFGIGLVTSAGSLGILIPPSIPMIVYCIFHTAAPLQVEQVFLAGVGPGLAIAALLGLFSLATAVRERIPRTPFSLTALATSLRAGIWALGLPVLVLGGIYAGVFNAIEAAAASCVYAVVVELYFHRSFRWRDMPRVLAETSVLLGSFVIVVVMAMSLAEFLEVAGVPHRLTAWIETTAVQPWTFLLALNVVLLVLGCLVDILSAIMILVPIVAPVAIALGIDPIHLAIVFIVNLEIGYLTPPVGLNLFLGGAPFRKPFGYMVRATLPFVLVMLVGLVGITYLPGVALRPMHWVYGTLDATPPGDAAAPPPTRAAPHGDEPSGAAPAAPPDRVLSLEEMMQLAEERQPADAGAAPPTAD